METISLNIADGVAVLTLNRPQAFNSLNDVMGQELMEVARQFATDEAIKCVVIQGGGANFMAGGDVSFFKHLVDVSKPGERVISKEMFDNVHGFIRALQELPKPVIASVQGAVAGIGISLMNACDLVVATENSFYSLAYCHIGASPDGGSSYFLPRTIGRKRAMEMILLGDRFTAQQVLEMGMVNWVVPSEKLQEETDRLTARLVAGPLHAYANGKRLVAASMQATLSQQLDLEEELFIDCTTTADYVEGVTAFCEKRPAVYVGR